MFHHDRLIATAICPELADRTVSLEDITAARQQRRHQLRDKLGRRTTIVDRLLDVLRPTPPGEAATDAPAASRLKRYRNE